MLKNFQYPLRSNVQELRTARKELKKAVTKAKNDWISANCDSVNIIFVSKGGAKMFWDNIKKLQAGPKKNLAE